ncbi:MAG: PAS domain S-box protein, partial [Desulfobulbaceae bacterium]|nr:PAS domain S-box protein [Desulfobulbaceae bacterium]
EQEVHLLKQLADDLAYGISVIRNQESYRHTVRALRDSEKKYRSLIANAYDAIILVDAESGFVLEANAAAERLLGRSQAEIVGMHRNEFCPGVDSELCQKILTCQPQGLHNLPEDMYVVRGEGRLIPVQVSASVVTVGSKKVIQGIFRDIGQKKQAEERLSRAQKMESLGALAGGIAHDFNNILSPILGYAELCLSMVDPSDKLHAFMGEILAATHRAKDLVRQIQTFSRKGEQESHPLLIQTIVKEALKFLRSSLPATIELHVDLDVAGGYVLCDPAQIHQMIMALCTNAYQAMLAKGGDLTVILRRVMVGGEHQVVPGLSPGSYLCLTVQDTGIGIAGHDISRIFEPYFSTKGPGEGTGMGLAVVDGIVRQCGGVVEVESQLGQGTTFRVYLPEIVDKVVPTEEDAVIGLLTGNQHILLVDDEPVVVTTMERMLTTLGYQVTSASDGLAALDIFQSQPDVFALVLTDQTMPRMSGIDLARGVLSLRPGLPVIILSGYEYLNSEDELATSGIKAFLRKPVGLAELARTLTRILTGD